MENGSSIVGRAKIGNVTTITGWSAVREPAIIGQNCKMEPNAHSGPYTTVGDRYHISFAEVDDSISADDARLEIRRKLMRSM